MDKLAIQKITPTFLFLFIFIIKTLVTATKSDYNPDHNGEIFSKNLSRKKLGLHMAEKLSHLHFYFHDVIAGRNPTAIRIAEGETTKNSSTWFGAVMMMDDPLTVGPELSSKKVGRAQGIYGSASQSEVGFLMVLNYVFTEGKYNGSTLSILGRNAALSEMREMPIVGGSGLFRFARGYAQAKTHTLNVETGEAVVEYNVYVLHY
ncbi:dirigent protein 22-like [Humulus lupulus]|uniref:dirigent protein 22-like n=1 Tax=Humulus lupulus TaxID=3486 RepID=UPI002B4136DE|nr:dirigent protein 22-like [Humulus lupulus]